MNSHKDLAISQRASSTHDRYIEPFVRCALDGIHREFPYHLTHVCTAEEHIQRPRDLFPVFYGCFDWHSAVHGHWLLMRGVRVLGDSGLAEECRAALNQSLRPEGLAHERAYLESHPHFERPYGLAWVLALGQEAHAVTSKEGSKWEEHIQPLVDGAWNSLAAWLPKLGAPIRTGTHNQTAFSMMLALEWAEACDVPEAAELIRSRARAFFIDDHSYPLHLEPSGEDFLSASLGAGWLMSAVLEHDEYLAWLERTMPELGRAFRFSVLELLDRNDGRLVHLDGANISRAWMLRDIMRLLPEKDPRLLVMKEDVGQLEKAGLASIRSQNYAGTHWLGTFAAYLLGRS